MQVKKKYKNLLLFYQLFDKFEDKNELVEVSEQEYQIVNKLINPIQDFIDKYDFDGDGVVTYNDIKFGMYNAVGKLKNDDPKLDKENNMYNGKSLDVNNDGDADISDSVNLTNKYLALIKSFTRNWEDKTETMCNWYIDYYNSHNYAWPTIEEADAHYDEIKNS